ncbi:four helix bundle protein [Moorena sp. SIO2C4]|uniref:four helix bundle protein n=1 Tax=Moorena sp. SIO2C4 TaxID=2607824 RepID=UPI00257D75C2|nr:four helix bundle protein [Moorena sp. SIO2C4]
MIQVIEVKSYRDLKVWNRAMDLVVLCYQLTSKLPKTEIYGLSSQIQREPFQFQLTSLRGKGDCIWETISIISP